MCLGVPGRILDIGQDALGVAMGRVDFGGVTKEVCLAYVPEARVGDYVIVHVGFAIGTVDAREAAEVFRLVREIDAAAGTAPSGTPEGPP